MISFKKAEEILGLLDIVYNREEKVAITDALGRYLAHDIIAPKSYPEADTAAMDGYAFKFKEGLSELKISGELAAGDTKTAKLKDGECVKTFTGALISEGADTLVPIENVSVDEKRLTINKPVPKGFAVRKVGESYSAGDVLMRRGERIGYAHIAVLAEIGIFSVSVCVKPKVAVLATGSEIKDIGEPLEHAGQIHSSNHVAIAAMLKEIGCEPILLPIVKDDKDRLKAALLSAFSMADVVISTGGVSVGDYDFMRDFAKSCEPIIDKIAIKPGRHIKISRFSYHQISGKNGDVLGVNFDAAQKILFALPGFAYSALATFALFARPLLLKMLGAKPDKPLYARLKNSCIKKSELTEFLPCDLEIDELGTLFAYTSNKKRASSAVSTNLLNKAQLCMIENDANAGDLVRIIKMSEVLF